MSERPISPSAAYDVPAPHSYSTGGAGAINTIEDFAPQRLRSNSSVHRMFFDPMVSAPLDQGEILRPRDGGAGPRAEPGRVHRQAREGPRGSGPRPAGRESGI